jgi:tRNA G10  N-methylase Trm11
MAEMLQGCRYVLDPFCGTGKIFQLLKWLPDTRFEGIEIEQEWKDYDERTTLGDATDLPWSDDTFDAICVSPAFGNRMADKHEATDESKRITYKHMLGHELHKNNAGGMQWGPEYRLLHEMAWSEARRVLVPGGKFVLNIKDHIRKGVTVPVTQWHIDTLSMLGFETVDHVRVYGSGMGFGQNHDKRVPYQSVILFVLR